MRPTSSLPLPSSHSPTHRIMIH